MFLNILIKSYTFLSSATSNKTMNNIITAIMIITFIIAISGCILASFAPQHIMFRLLTIGITFSVIMTSLLIYYSTTRRQLLLKLVDRLYNNTPDFARKDITREAEADMEARYWMWAAGYIGSNLPDVFLPFANFFINDEIDFTDPNLMCVPHFMQVKTDSVWKYVGITVLSGVVFSILIISYWMATFFIMYVMVNLEHHIKEIRVLFEDVLDRCLSSCTKEKEFETAMQKELITLIKYQQFTHR